MIPTVVAGNEQGTTMEEEEKAQQEAPPAPETHPQQATMIYQDQEGQQHG